MFVTKINGLHCSGLIAAELISFGFQSYTWKVRQLKFDRKESAVNKLHFQGFVSTVEKNINKLQRSHGGLERSYKIYWVKFVWIILFYTYP